MKNSIGLKLFMGVISITPTDVVGSDFKHHVITNEDEDHYYIERDMGEGFETLPIKKTLGNDESIDYSNWVVGKGSVMHVGADGSQLVCQVITKDITHPDIKEPIISFHRYIPNFDPEYDEEFSMIWENSFIKQANEYLATAKGFERVMLSMDDGQVEVVARHYCHHCGHEQKAA